MSETPFPTPQTTAFNPSAWNIEGLTEDEETYLDTHFVRFPNPQSGLTFPDAPTAPTLTNGTNTAEVATTGFVQNAITAFKAATNVWSALNTFNGGLSATSITKTGTLTITGTPLALSGTRLDTTMTPNYSYPIASGNLGEFITGTNTSLAVTASTPTSISSINLPEGIWLLYSQIQGAGNSIFFTLAFSTTTNSITSGVIAIDSCPVAGTGPAQTLTYPVVVPAPVSPATTTTYYMVVSIGTTQTLTNCVLLATRIA
jgi:hypothetical protein